MNTQEFQKLAIREFAKNSEFQQYVIDQFSKVATKDDLKGFATKEDLRTEISNIYLNMATKSELAEVKSDIYNIHASMATKSELAEVKEIVLRLDKRSDEDIRATMKDVEKIKGVLNQQGYQI